MAINWKFISEREGGQLLKGYVPDPEHSQSGVTIATGIDIGQMSAAGIDNLAVSDALKVKMKPYAGVKGQAAVDLLAKRSLTVTKDEADLLDRVVKGAAAAKIKADYNRAVGGDPTGPSFDALSDEAQTILCSVGFQYGDLPSRTPRFWRACTEQRWTDARDELRNFGDRYSCRRNKEADLLERGREIMTA